MGIQNPGIPLLLIVVLLAVGHLSSSRNIPTEALAAERFNSKFFGQFYAAPPKKLGNGEEDPVYGASDRTVPGGPNPLHN
ncbi:hypothetical protein NMG60_11030425 [Bertholletia excelsa]